MDSWFKKKDLVYTIAKEQSFSKASQKLFIAQPSLSAMIKKLEEEIGFPLFDRSCKPVQLTEAGQAYLHATEQIMDVERTYSEYIMALNKLETGELRIGSNQLLSTLVLPQYISTFLQSHPNIHLTLMDANSTSLENAISDGSLDLVIDNSLLSQDVFEQGYLATEHLLLAVPSNFKENDLCLPYRLSYESILQNHYPCTVQPVPLSFFSNTPFVLMNRDNDIRKQANAIFQETHFNPRVLFELDRLTTLYTYVSYGIGATLVSDTLIRNIKENTMPDIAFYMLPSSHNTRNIYVSYKKNKFCTKSMATFMDLLTGLS